MSDTNAGAFNNALCALWPSCDRAITLRSRFSKAAAVLG
jgi:hypothetical protein